MLHTPAHPDNCRSTDSAGCARGVQRVPSGVFQIPIVRRLPYWCPPNCLSRWGHGDPEMEFAKMHQSTFLTQEEAADACAKSYDTIRRYRRLGRLPNSRTRVDGTVEVAVADLVMAGLLDALASTSDVATVVARSRVERNLAASREECTVLRTRCEGLLERVERADGEIAFLRSMLGKFEVVR